jgi:hypothetical protein
MRSSTTVLRSWNTASDALRPRVRWLRSLRGGDRWRLAEGATLGDGARREREWCDSWREW